MSETENREPPVVVRLMSTLQEFDAHTAQHCEQTVELAVLVARRLGADAHQQGVVARVARLHDIGKLGVPRELVRRPGPLDAREQAVMRAHTEIGQSILGCEPDLEEVGLAVRHQHERWDGRGYPDGIAGEAIPLASRIVLACDAWQAMTAGRPYRDALGREEALAELERCAGTQFDPSVVAALLGALGAYGRRAA